MWQKHRCIFFYEEMGMTEWVITTAVTLGIGIISYFLKRTMNQSDKTVQKLQAVEQSAVTKEELKENRKELQEEINRIREDYTPKKTHEKDFDECRKDIKDIRASYLTRDDFIREMNKMDRKLDQMLELMMKK